jgi:salicylate hydroxylase
VQQYEKLRRARTDVIQAGARKNGLRYDSKYADLDQRDREIANSAAFRKSLFDYDVEKVAIAHLKENRHSPDGRREVRG